MSTGRNDPCPCGSGKKFKKCCGGDAAAPVAPRPAVDPNALLQQAMRLHQAGQLAQADALYRQILSVRPQEPNALQLSGLIAHQSGDHERAVALMEKSLKGNPNVAEWHFNLGSTYAALQRPGDAERHFLAALKLRGTFAEAAFRLGLARAELGRQGDAAQAFRHALEIQPDYPEAAFNLGNALAATAPDEATAAYRQALALRPAYPQAHTNLGNLLRRRGRLDQALEHFRAALALDPDSPSALSNLAAALLVKPGGASEAAQLARRATQLAPTHGDAWNNLCAALQGLGQLDEALAAGRQAVAVAPNLALAWNNLASACQDAGRIDEALAGYRRAVELDPAYAAAHANFLFALNFLPGLDGVAVLAEHREWARRHAAPAQLPPRPFIRDARPLRIGYVSPDFRDHAVAWFIEPVLAAHRPAEVEVFCYASVAAPEATTARLQALVPHWRDIAGLDDGEAAQAIRDDAIDILVDLAGHTAGGRLGIFARKPAPLQMTWLGYLNTTGLAQIDYRISDQLADPPAAQVHHCEKLLYLPHAAWCYRPPAEAREPGAAPLLRNGYPTFAAFNNFAKTSAPVAGLWQQILTASPQARLLVLAKDAPLARRSLAAAGLDEARLEVRPTCNFADYLALHREVDILLDSFPYNGATTTCHALWMGVPVVSLSADSPPAARSGASLLATVGLGELAAATPQEYVAKALALAGNPAHLAELRGTLRQRVTNSPLCDAASFTANLEEAYRRAWNAL